MCVLLLVFKGAYFGLGEISMLVCHVYALWVCTHACVSCCSSGVHTYTLRPFLFLINVISNAGKQWRILHFQNTVCYDVCSVCGPLSRTGSVCSGSPLSATCAQTTSKHSKEWTKVSQKGPHKGILWIMGHYRWSRFCALGERFKKGFTGTYASRWIYLIY